MTRPMADGINAATNSSRPTGRTASNGAQSKPLDRTSPQAFGQIKSKNGPDLILCGSSTLTPVLIEHGLADEIILLTCPVL